MREERLGVLIMDADRSWAQAVAEELTDDGILARCAPNLAEAREVAREISICGEKQEYDTEQESFSKNLATILRL